MRLLLRIYPRAWRERYGAEFEALLRDEGLSPWRVCDIVWTALVLRWEAFGPGLNRDAHHAQGAYRKLRPLQKFALAMAWLTAGITATKAHDIFSGASFVVLVAAISALNLLAQGRGEGRASVARRGLAALLFAAMTIDATISSSRWTMMPIILAIIPQVHPWPRRDRVWALRLGTAFCSIVVGSCVVAVATGRNGISGLIVGTTFAALGSHLERERRSVARGERVV